MSAYFKIEFKIDDGDGYIVTRSVESLQSFAKDLLESQNKLIQKLSENSIRFLHVIIERPILEFESSMSVTTSTNELELALDAQRLHALLTECLNNSEIIRGTPFSEFLWEGRFMDAAVTAAHQKITSQCAINPSSALDFLLQPFESTNIYIPCREYFFVDFSLPKGSSLVWRFQVGGGYDVGFGVLFKEYLIYKSTPMPDMVLPAGVVTSTDAENLYDLNDSDSEDSVEIRQKASSSPSSLNLVVSTKDLGPDPLGIPTRQTIRNVPSTKFLEEVAAKKINQFMKRQREQTSSSIHAQRSARSMVCGPLFCLLQLELDKLTH